MLYLLVTNMMLLRSIIILLHGVALFCYGQDSEELSKPTLASIRCWSIKVPRGHLVGVLSHWWACSQHSHHEKPNHSEAPGIRPAPDGWSLKKVPLCHSLSYENFLLPNSLKNELNHSGKTVVETFQLCFNPSNQWEAHSSVLPDSWHLWFHYCNLLHSCVFACVMLLDCYLRAHIFVYASLRCYAMLL